ncbi:MAG: DUF2779 domain-containing protein [Thiobacillus sp.]|nr:DUF2779 domain-containing protein [Thiobacillus sp.]
MKWLSKSKLLAYRQCPKRLWLEIHRQDLRVDSAATKASFQIGHTVGEIARELYNSEKCGTVLDPMRDGFDVALEQTQTLLKSAKPIFEATFTSGGALAMADVMLPIRQGRRRAWRMVEVKSSTKIKDYHLDDIAIQSYIVRAAGIPLASIALAHLDNQWIYPGGDDYAGLLRETDLTEQATSRNEEVEAWIAAAQKIARKRKEPDLCTGRHCSEPYACGFIDYCGSQEPQAEYPVSWLPDIRTKALKEHIEQNDLADMRDVPDELLNDQQRRVKKHTLSGKPYFDRKGAQAALKPHGLPAYFLDFETISLPVPIWKGTRPFQKIPFQFSVHRLSRTGTLTDKAFLDLSGKDPSKKLVEALLDACGKRGPIFVYNASFEKGCIKELADRFPRHGRALMALHERIVDLLPIVQAHYYHPDQEGSWSIKSVLPTIAPELSYANLYGVRDGGMAMIAYFEAIQFKTTATRKKKIERELLDYCGLDTLAMVRLWRTLAE